ncbi:hypothetical protein IJ00_10235 [Calothrix sp. 336/3]|nr:hypothetical protein IJ00_10235 [Calothrix sp. 336/3]
MQKMFTTDTPPALSGTRTLREAAPRLWGGILSMCRIVFSNWYKVAHKVASFQRLVSGHCLQKS